VRVIWSPTARRQLNAAIDLFGDDRPQAALAWLDGLVQRVELLTELPEQGRVVPEWGADPVREVMYEPFRVVYEIHDDRVEILVLSHFRQSFPEKRGSE
jgi:plasmid stabilization system protein ParE